MNTKFRSSALFFEWIESSWLNSVLCSWFGTQCFLPLLKLFHWHFKFMWVFQGHQLPLSWGGKRLQALTSSSWKGKKYNLFYCGLILCERSFSPFIILGPCRLSSRLLPRPFVKKDLLLDVTAFAVAPEKCFDLVCSACTVSLLD